MLFQLYFDTRRLALGIVKLDSLIVEPDLKSSEVDRNLSVEFTGIWLKP